MADLDSPLDQLLDTRVVPNIDGNSQSFAAIFLDFALDGADGRRRRIGIRWEGRGRGVGIAGGFRGYNDYIIYLVYGKALFRLI